MNLPLCGLFLVDKSVGFTSHQVVGAIRFIIKKQTNTAIKVGHLGTLDPFASGLLPILIGGATRLSDEMMDGQKQYLFEIQLGTQTDTLDNCGQVVKTASVKSTYLSDIEKILPQFTGDIEQVPPAYSALKMGGRPLYEYMRAEGKLPFDIEDKKRIVRIDKIELVKKTTNENCVTLRVICGKGTYVRSLARDISIAIGTVGHCVTLRREMVSPWLVDNAFEFSEIKKPTFEDIQKNCIEPKLIFPEIENIVLLEKYDKLFTSGNIICVPKLEISNENWEIIGESKLCFVTTSNGQICYLCNVQMLNENVVQVRPQKKIF